MDYIGKRFRKIMKNYPQYEKGIVNYFGEYRVYVPDFDTCNEVFEFNKRNKCTNYTDFTQDDNDF